MSNPNEKALVKLCASLPKPLLNIVFAYAETPQTVWYTKYGTIDLTGYPMANGFDMPYTVVTSAGEPCYYFVPDGHLNEQCLLKDVYGQTINPTKTPLKIRFSYMRGEFTTRVFMKKSEVPRNLALQTLLSPFAIISGVTSGVVYGFGKVANSSIVGGGISIPLGFLFNR